MVLDESKVQERERLRDQVRTLEAELSVEHADSAWPPKGFYLEYYATTGFILGMIAAAMSLLVNVVGAPIAGKSPLELIRIYLTFPLGERALQLTTAAKEVSLIGDGLVLAIGCCLYLGTGMLLGVPFFVALSWLTEGKSFAYRFFIATLMSVIIWVVGFYGILSWLQPALLNGHWITDPQILPPWVALATHLVFGWTLTFLYPWGRFQSDRRTEKH